MPTYDYECTKCDRRFEVFQSITARSLRRIKTECDQCNNRAPVRRLIGAGAAVLFKGSGFYETDYRSSSYKQGAEAEKKPATKKDAAAGKPGAGPAKDKPSSPASDTGSTGEKKPKKSSDD